MHAAVKIFVGVGLKRALHACGSTLAIAGVAFVTWRLYSYSDALDLGLSMWLVVIGLATVSGLSSLMLGLAWWQLLKYFGKEVSGEWAVQAYGHCQIAKYIPGNIFHLASRHAVGLAVGIPSRILAKSAIWEIVSISGAAAVFSLLTFPLLAPGLSMVAASSIFVIILGLALALLTRLFGLPVARAFGLHLGFLAISGLLFVELIQVLADDVSLPWPVLASGYIVAWLVGLLMPGAPAGLGVRELVLLFLFDTAVLEADLLLAVLLGRVVTVLGDSALFAAVTITRKR